MLTPLETAQIYDDIDVKFRVNGTLQGLTLIRSNLS